MEKSRKINYWSKVTSKIKLGVWWTEQQPGKFFQYLDIFWHMAFTGGSDESNSCYRFMTGGLTTTSSQLSASTFQQELEEASHALTEPPVFS